MSGIRAQLFRFLDGQLVAFSLNSILDSLASCIDDYEFHQHTGMIQFSSRYQNAVIELDGNVIENGKTFGFVIKASPLQYELWHSVFMIMKVDYVALMCLSGVFHANLNAVKHYDHELFYIRPVKSTFLESCEDLQCVLR